MARDALEFAREAGIVPTEVLGRPIQLVYFDARTDPVEAANGATRLIQVEKVVAIIGTMCSGVYLGAAEIVQKAGVPMIGPTTTNPLTTQVGDYCFRACFKDDDQGPVAAALARDYFGAKTAAVVIDVAQAYCVGLGNTSARPSRLWAEKSWPPSIAVPGMWTTPPSSRRSSG
jgi:branched-chain amino acid transport system substrate-binding protein